MFNLFDVILCASDSVCSSGNVTWKADPESCSKYILCLDGGKQERECEEGLHFNDKVGYCDAPQYAGCEETGKCR